MGQPESGTQHAEAPDVEVPAAPPAFDPLLPPAPPPPPPASLPTSIAPDEPTSTVGAEHEPSSEPAAAAGAALGKVTDFADRRPELFLAGAFAAGLVVGRMLRRRGDSDDADE